jgi:glycosyltransferase involved in cell wall biosynthesis
MTGPVEHVVVVVPARNEQDLIAGCLRSLTKAASATAGPSIHIVVVLDDCSDATAQIASGFPVDVRMIAARSVGAARAHGVAHGLSTTPAPLARTWIANTDADSQVPTHWLTRQLAHADLGADVVVGTVRPDPVDLSDQQLASWSATRTRGRPNGHVHGANLGVRADAYVRAGGFGHETEHEDVHLVQRIASTDSAVLVACDEGDVLTSGRTTGRTPGGYARYLRTALPG